MLAQLDTKTVYTFMDSMVTIDAYVARAKELGYRQLGVMDMDTLYAAYAFIESCQKADIQPIIGCEMALDFAGEGQAFRVQFIALNTIGYRNLLKISTTKMLGQHAFENFRQYLDGVAVILPYQAGIEQIQLDIDYYVGVYPDTPDISMQQPLLPLRTVRYFQKEQTEVLQVLHAIRENVPLSQVNDVSPHQEMLSPGALEELFQQRFPQAIANLEKLVRNVKYELSQDLKLPRFNRSRPAVEELRERAQAGILERNLTGPAYQARLEQELQVIHRMGFDDYFLIVWDLIRFGRSQGYYMGMGRGSAVGSLVAYSLQITGIDPVKHNLLFERFLNLERFTMPDIDIDIPDVYRPEFIRYVRDRYGSMHSAQIVTYSTFGAKQAIRDVFKRFGTPEYELTNLTKKISFRDDLTSAYEKNASFRQQINSKPEYQTAFAIAKQIEGQPRQTSIHAAGVVMSDEDLTDTIPLKIGEDMLITQYDAHAVEANGLLKMDFLGLRNLTFVQRMKEAVAVRYQKEIIIEEIDLEDAETLKLFAAGQTKGIFQFEQPGAISLLKRVQPSSFEDVVATTSLNRPGASDYADNFVKRKHGQEAVDLLDPSIAAILEPTYGIMLYQEQVMQIAQVFAGFSLGKADILRRAMGKKDASEMLRMKEDFMQGAARNGHSQQQAERIFSMMAKFAGYGFNRSHAYAYSALAFQLAYFKVHYPDVFFDILMNRSSGDYLQDALQFGFQVVKQGVNTVPYHDKIEGGKIALGLKRIKGLPRDFSLWILENRSFASVEDFILKLPENYQKKDWISLLVQAGLFDQLESNRQKILTNLENLFIFAETFGTFFAEETYAWTEAEDFTDSQKYEMEKELLGIGVSPHPLLKLKKESPVAFDEISQLLDGKRQTILVQIQDVRTIRTKSAGELMAFIQVTDAVHNLDVTAFPEVYKQLQAELVPGAIYYMTGRVQLRNERLQLILETIRPVSSEKFWILVENESTDQAIADVLKRFPGECPVVIHYQETGKTVRLNRPFVAKSPVLESELQSLVLKTIYR